MERLSMLTRTAKALLTTVMVFAILAAPVRASSGDVIRDCSEDGVLNRHYSQKELSGALDNLPSDLDEYTDCRTVIRQAQLGGAGGKSGHHEGRVARLADTKKPPSADERGKIEQATKSPHGVRIGGQTVHPGAAGATLAGTGLGTDLPPLMLAALIGLAAAMVSGATFAARRRWPAAWRTADASIRRVGDGVRRGISRLRR
jgi:hypothetical protein